MQESPSLQPLLGPLSSSSSSHLPPSSSPPALHPLRLSVKFLTFVCDCVQVLLVWWRPNHRLVGPSSLLDLQIPPAATLSLRWSGVHLLSVWASAFSAHTRTPHYATSSSREQTKWNPSCVRQMDFLRLKKCLGLTGVTTCFGWRESVNDCCAFYELHLRVIQLRPSLCTEHVEQFTN